MGELFADLYLLVGIGHCKCLLVRIDGDKLNALCSGLDHSVDYIVAGTADTDYFYCYDIFRAYFGFEIHDYSSNYVSETRTSLLRLGLFYNFFLPRSIDFH